MALAWIESAGGPLLVAPQSVLALWTGATDYEGPVEASDDYERACAVEGYIGLVPIGALDGLVLGGEPATTTYLPAQRLFVRWCAANGEEELVAAAVGALHEGVDWHEDEDLLWAVDGPVVLVDAGWPGADPEPGKHLVADLEPGRYRVRAAFLNAGHNWMILVQLQPADQPDSAAKQDPRG